MKIIIKMIKIEINTLKWAQLICHHVQMIVINNLMGVIDNSGEWSWEGFSDCFYNDSCLRSAYSIQL